MASKKHEAVLHRVRELMDGLDEDTTTLSKPHDDGTCADSGCTDTFIEHSTRGWDLDEFMRRHARWMDACDQSGNLKCPCSMDALYIREKDGVLYLVEFKRDRILMRAPKAGEQCDHHLFVDHACDSGAKKNADYYHWLCRKMTDTVLAFTARGIADLQNGSWRKRAIAYIVIDGKRNGLRGAGNPVGARIRAAAMDYAAFPELRGYLFDEIHIVDEQRFRKNILPQMAPDPDVWVKNVLSR
ncbi:hypothetical protein [Bifidobacterium pseudolongum]|uniref:Uncharacterized protein n=1 Tax=Bifidobacterium pseudolongum TaxID=1694 RepID=A0A395XFQ6_9BIFI|nr:hypothetical protein [Bifidobacterium pseudolongum]RGW08677.1 hypothetical protein DWV92_07535 [Bifidobacterium pseudolongum]